MNRVMIHDLRSILDGWEYEPGKISVRKIIGRDGREKLQTRVDLGLLQLELAGRPDSLRPHGCETFLDFIEQRLRQHAAGRGKGAPDEGFTISAEECRELRHEAHLFYQRFLSLFVLEDFEGVERDTSHNLRIFELCRRYAVSDGDRGALEGQRPYVIMMNVRAQTYAALKRREYEAASARVEDGLLRLRASGEEESGGWGGAGDDRPELKVLAALRQEVLERMPADAAPRLRWELETALEREDYERAAQLRDRLSNSRSQHPPAA
jgi:hypothetical protein